MNFDAMRFAPYLQQIMGATGGPGQMDAGAAVGGVPPSTQTPAMQSPGSSSGQLDPGLVDAVLQLQGGKGVTDRIGRQRALANQLQQQSQQQLQGRANGGIYTAPTALNAIASLGQQWKANQLNQDADVQSQNMDVQRQDALRRYFQAATNQKQQPLGYMGGEGE